MTVLIVGSLAYDSVTSPYGKVDEELGGSATYGGLACQFHLNRLTGQQASLVGVVGTDFAASDLALLSSSGLDLSGLTCENGKTFRWEGAYHGTMAEAETLATNLNVFESFRPEVPTTLRAPQVLFCANLHPLIQISVMEQVSPHRLVMLDSMNLWMSIAREELILAMKKADLIIINDGEARMLAAEQNLVRAMQKIVQMTASNTLIVKRGEHGVLAIHAGEFLALPAYPTEDVVDPTGCGDSFAGALAAIFSQSKHELQRDELRHALMVATVTASFTLEDFGTKRLATLSNQDFEQRFFLYQQILST